MGAELDLDGMNKSNALYCEYKLKSNVIDIGNKLSDFEKIGDPVGEGAYGKVWKVRSINTKKIYALKDLTQCYEILYNTVLSD